jgi:hypothetical protein
MCFYNPQYATKPRFVQATDAFPSLTYSSVYYQKSMQVPGVLLALTCFHERMS